MRIHSRYSAFLRALGIVTVTIVRGDIVDVVRDDGLSICYASVHELAKYGCNMDIVTVALELGRAYSREQRATAQGVA